MPPTAMTQRRSPANAGKQSAEASGASDTRKEILMAESDEHLVPDSPLGYRVEFADEYKNMTVDKTDKRWLSAIADAHEAKLTHAQFKTYLNRHAKGVMDAHEAKARTPAQAAPAKPAAPEVPYKDLSMSAKLAKYGHA